MSIRDHHQLSKRFIHGLSEYGLTAEEVRDKWWNCGHQYAPSADNSTIKNAMGLRYFYEWFDKTRHDPPEHADNCICGESIMHNFWITNGTEVLIIGSECINKFCYRSGKSCSICKEPHLNRLDNICNTCRASTKDQIKQENIAHQLLLETKQICKLCFVKINVNKNTKFIYCFHCNARKKLK